MKLYPAERACLMRGATHPYMKAEASHGRARSLRATSLAHEAETIGRRAGGDNAEMLCLRRLTDGGGTWPRQVW